jgi:Protein of unknown function (DUF2905)
MDSTTAGRILLILGLLAAAVGGYLAIGGKLPFGSLPGDVSLKSGNVSFAFPIVSCIVISIVLTIVLNIFLRR